MSELRVGPVSIDRFGSPRLRKSMGTDQTFDVRCLVRSRSEAHQLVELVGNEDRRQRLDNHQGVLEYVEWDASEIATFAGWCLLTGAEIEHRTVTVRRSGSDAWVPVRFSAVQVEGKPVVVATHRDRTTDFAVTPEALVPPLYPYTDLQSSTVTRAAYSVNLGLLQTSDKKGRVVYSQDTFRPKLALRPRLVDPQGVSHYGPVRTQYVSGWRMDNGLVRVTFRSPDSGWLVHAMIDGTWEQVASLQVLSATLDSPYRWARLETTHKDGEVSVRLQSEKTTILRATLRAGEHGVRLSGDTHHVIVRDPDDSTTNDAEKAANYYQDNVDQSWGGRRMLALVTTPTSDSLTDWRVETDECFFGVVPPTPGTGNTVSEQAAQFLSDRSTLLTLE